VLLTIGGGLGWLAAIATPGSPFIVNFGAFLIWLCGVGLLMLATADLARYKGRRPGVWITITAVVYFTTLGYLPLILLALMPNLGLQAQDMTRLNARLDAVLALLQSEIDRLHIQVDKLTRAAPPKPTTTSSTNRETARRDLQV
jgi:hypothetical protein